jgi:hypothetical protein
MLIEAVDTITARGDSPACPRPLLHKLGETLAISTFKLVLILDESIGRGLTSRRRSIKINVIVFVSCTQKYNINENSECEPYKWTNFFNQGFILPTSSHLLSPVVVCDLLQSHEKHSILSLARKVTFFGSRYCLNACNDQLFAVAIAPTLAPL